MRKPQIFLLASLWAVPVFATDRTVCSSGCNHTNIAAAIAAVPSSGGDNIILTAGQIFHQTTALVLPDTQYTNPVTIKSSIACPSSPVRRVTPADVALMPIITSNFEEAAIEGTGIKNWRFECLRFVKDSEYTVDAAIFILNKNLGGGNWQNSDNIIFNQIIIEGGASGSWTNGLYIHGSNYTVKNSYIYNIRYAGRESHGIVYHSGPGPYTFQNNYIEAGSINHLAGGWTADSENHTPNNILVEDNHFFKRLAWIGAGFGVKNLFELKHATNVIVRNNTFENNWTDAQDGHGILFQATNDAGDSPWTKITDVDFYRNQVINTERGINLNGHDYTAGHESYGMERVTFRENLFTITTGRILTVVNEVKELTLNHNTFVNANTDTKFGIMIYGLIAIPGNTTRPADYAIRDYTFTNNILRYSGGHEGEFGLMGTSGLDEHVDVGYTWSHNVMADGPDGHTYPGTNYYPSVATLDSDWEIDYTLKTGSAYNNAGTDGLDIGWFGQSPEGGGTGGEVPTNKVPNKLLKKRRG
jgi:hypothetical protein